MDAQTEEILLAEARDGSDTSFEQLVLAQSDRAIGLALRLVGDRHEAEDIAQEAFIRLHRSLAGFRGDCRLSTWMYRTVSRLAIDHLRREKIKRAVFFFRPASMEEEEGDSLIDRAPSTAASPEDNVLHRESGRRLRRALEKLSARQRAVFTLRHFEELSLKEIGAILGLEEGTVKVHLHRAVTALRVELADYRAGG